MTMTMTRTDLAEAIETEIVSVARMVGGAVLTDDQIDEIACVAAQDVLRYALTLEGAAEVVEGLRPQEPEEEAPAAALS